MSTTETKLEEVQRSLDLGMSAIALEQLLTAGRLMDEQITLCQQTISLQNAAIKQISERLRVVEEMQGELDCGEVNEEKSNQI